MTEADGDGSDDTSFAVAWPSQRAVAAGLVVEAVGVVALASVGSTFSLPGFYVPEAPARAGSVLGGAVAGYGSVRSVERGSERTGPRGLAAGLGVGLAGLVAGGVGVLLRTPAWPLVIVAGLAVAGRVATRGQGVASVVATAGALALLVLAVGGRLRVGVGLVLSAAALVPRVGAYAFLAPAAYGAVLLALSLAANAVGGALGGLLAGRRSTGE